MSDVSGEQYSIAQNSVLKWLGRKVGGEHTGTIALTDGFIRVEKGMIKAGQFGVDMKSIVVSDITDAGMNTKLVEHLKSADFFDVEKNPTAMFMLNEVFASGSEMIARGDLTVKGTTHPLQFPIIVTQEGNQMRVKADFFIDKDLWSISSNPVVDKYLGI
jgi:polyisoprenoid-binding protein YceI